MIVRRKITLCCFATLLTLLLTGCGCNHEWQRSTCQTPRTCIHCGETEGKVRGHEWGNTDCNAPEGCIVCGTLEGIELTHTWQEDCKICIHCGLDERPADDRFPEMLAAGLEAKWQMEKDFREKSAEDEVYALTKADWENLFAAEYDRLSSFQEDTFQDEALGEAAKRYIKSIDQAREALVYFGTDQWEDEYHNNAYWAQAEALFEIHAIRPVSVGEDYQETLTQMVNNGEIIKMVRPLLGQIQFLHINTTGERKKFETTVKNTTSLTFEWFSLDVNLLDEKGGILDTHNVKVINWKPDQKHRFNFNTEIDFAAIDVAFANWKLPARR